MEDQTFSGGAEARGGWHSYTQRVWLAVLVVSAAGGAILLLWLAYKVALLAFASVLLGIFLRTLTDWTSRVTRLGAGWSFSIVLAALAGICALAGWLLATPVSNEVDQLTKTLPKAIQNLQSQMERYQWGRFLLQKLQNPSGMIAQAGGMMRKAQAVFSISIEGLIDFWVIIFCGFYLTIRPRLYIEGFLRLVPRGNRPRARMVLDEIGNELRHWLFGQIVSMTILGLLTWLGLFLLGIPLSELLGLLAGVLDFVPVAGPWVAGIISCMMALLKSPMHAVYVASLFVGLHLLEGHVVIPLVQKQATRLPPVLTILAMILFYRLFGFFGLFLATPLLALVLIATKALYVEDVIEAHDGQIQQAR